MGSTMMRRLMAIPSGWSETGVLKPFSSLLLAQVIGTALGLVFWVVCARLVPADGVGHAAAAISTQTLVGTLTTLGLGTLFIAELPLLPATRQRRVLLVGLGCVGIAAVVLGLLVVSLARFGTETLREAIVSPAGGFLFVLGVAGAGAAMVLDQATLGLRRSRVQVMRNLWASVLRFPLVALLVVLGHRDQLVLQAAWVVPLVLSAFHAWWRLGLPRSDDAPSALSAVREVATYWAGALRNHALNLALAAGSQLVPVVAAVVLSPVLNAHFAVAWLVATFVFLPPYMLATALFSASANQDLDAFRKRTGTTLPASLALSTVLALVAVALAPWVLAIFGREYADDAAHLLVLLVPAGLWMVVKDHLVALWRSQREFGYATRLTGASVVLEVFGAAAGGIAGGATGLCVGWLAAIAAEAWVAAPLIKHVFTGVTWWRPTRPLSLRLSRSGPAGTMSEEAR